MKISSGIFAISKPGKKLNGYDYFCDSESMRNGTVQSIEARKIFAKEFYGTTIKMKNYHIHIKDTQMTNDLFNNKGAIINDEYRYALWRIWDHDKPKVLFIMLNPSTADGNYNDQTMHKCVAIVKQMEEYGGLYVGNLFAYRETKPARMKKAKDPVGPSNDEYLKDMSSKCDLVIFAWGNHGRFKDRDKEVAAMYPEAMCLGTNQNGTPKHPLFIKSTQTLMKYKIRP